RALDMRGFRTFLYLLSPRTQLLGLYHQQVTAGIDAYIIELGCLSAQLLNSLHVLFKLTGIGRINLVKRHTRLTIRQSKDNRLLRAQEKRAFRHHIEKGTVVTANNDGY